MKKITFLLVTFLICSNLLNSQSLTVNTINGLPPADFFSSGTSQADTFPLNTTVPINITYTNLAGDINIRMWDKSCCFSNVLLTTSNIKNDTNPNNITIDWTPDTEVTNYTLQIHGTAGQFGSTANEFFNKSVVSGVTLSSNEFNKTKLSAYYSSYTDAVIVDNSVTGKYAIYNLLGQYVQQGEISREIGVNTLKSGLYILTTESGLLKFAK